MVGHQRGWEILTDGVHEPLMELPDFRTFALDLAREAIELATAPPLPSTDRDVVVVTDPHYNTLVAHEIVGHPERAGPRAQDGDGLRGPLVAPRRPGRHAGGPAHRLAARVRLLRSRAPRVRPLRLRPRRHARPPRRPHRPGRLPGIPEQPADGGDLRRRAERPLQGGRRVARPADPDVEHGVRRGRRRPRARSCGTSSAATTWSPTGSPRSPRAARTSGSRRGGSTRSERRAGSALPGRRASRPTRATT